MIKQDNLYIGEEARTQLMKGVSKVAQVVGRTMGTGGENGLIECLESPGHFSTNDGYTLASSIKLADPLEEVGRSVLVEAISKANKQSGDGSSTTCVLTSAILEEGMKHIGEVSPMEIKRSLENCIPLIEKSVEAQKRDISIDEVAPAASVSAGDEEIGQRIQEIYKQIGPKGVIQWDISKTSEDSYSIGTGLKMDGATYISPYMCDIDEKTGRFANEVRWADPLILLTQQKITSAMDFEVLFQGLFNKEIREVVVFCNEIEAPVVADLIRTRAIRGFKTVVVKMPVLWRDEWWEDLAIATGATIVSPVSGVTLRTVEFKHLGKVGHLTVNREDTFLDGIQDISQHVLNLQAQGDDKSLLRASRLNTRTARYFVGAHSESALAYRRLKVEDAINAASCALENGVVAGGGVALFEASKKLPKDEIGTKILRQALKVPLTWIIENAGWKITDHTDSSKKEIHMDGGNFEGGRGINSKTAILGDMFEMGIVDPMDVVLNAIRNAIGVAAAILTVGSVITLPRDEDTKQMRGV